MVQIHALSPAAIQRGLDDLALDVGVTDLDTEPLSRVSGCALYDEGDVFVAGRSDDHAGRATISWRAAA